MTKKDVALILGTVAAVVILAFAQLQPGVVQTGAWGLHFSQAG